MAAAHISTLSDAQVELLAAAARTRFAGSGGADVVDAAHRDLEPDRASVRAIPAHLASLGLGLSHEAGGRALVTALDDELVERAAVLEHQRWMDFTRSRGYRYGPVRDDRALHHPDLVPWEQLDEVTRDKDRDRIRAIPEIVAAAGLVITAAAR